MPAQADMDEKLHVQLTGTIKSDGDKNVKVPACSTPNTAWDLGRFKFMPLRLIAHGMQAAEAARKRAKNAGEVMTYLAEFATVSDFSELSELFQDDSRLAEAAVSPCKAAD